MLAEEKLQEGKLDEALSQLQDAIRKDPSNAKLRVFLFQLLSVMGDWNRALTQLNVAGELDAGTLAMVQAYSEALNCEVLRAEIFAGKRSPLVFGEPEQWVALLMESLNSIGKGNHVHARQLRDQALDAAPATSGTLTAAGMEGGGEAFEWIADADARIGPVLEALVNGRYFWIPFQRIRQIDIEEPNDLRDMVWVPAHFTWANGGEAVGLIPTRYAGSESSEDHLIRLARKTDWIQCGEGDYQGAGQRILVTDTGEFPLMDVRQIVLETSDESAAETTTPQPSTEAPSDG